MFNPNISIGQVLSEKDVYTVFNCQTTFGIRLSKQNNAIVIISDATPKNVYADTWDGDTLLYTGTDAHKDSEGNQTLYGVGNNNGALYAVWDAPADTRPTLFLFMKYAPNQCTYKGVVELAEKPFQAPKTSGSPQLTWKFPLRLSEAKMEDVLESYSDLEQNASAQSRTELLSRIQKKEKNPNYVAHATKRQVSTETYDRDPDISAYAKLRANGICDLCGSPAPFSTKEGKPYLETHHIVWLSRGGTDSIDNVVALCPNCHRKMHVLADPNDEAGLRKIAQKRL